MKFSATVENLERLIEKQGLKCRIYTSGRIAAAGDSVAGGITGGFATRIVAPWLQHGAAR